MGVDFRNSGMTYQRYDNLVLSVANLFHAEHNIHPDNDVFYPFGYLGEAVHTCPNFKFKEDIPDIIQRWCNSPYSDKLTSIDMQKLANILILHQDDIECDICSLATLQSFIYELIYCIEYDKPWYIC